MTEVEKYTRQLALIADNRAKFRLSQTQPNQYIAGTATRSTGHQGAASAAEVTLAEADAEASAAVDAAEADLAVDQERCMMQFVQNAENLAKFRSNLQVTDQFTAETAIKNSKAD